MDWHEIGTWLGVGGATTGAGMFGFVRWWYRNRRDDFTINLATKDQIIAAKDKELSDLRTLFAAEIAMEKAGCMEERKRWAEQVDKQARAASKRLDRLLELEERNVQLEIDLLRTKGGKKE